jgi:hypothetical protein
MNYSSPRALAEKRLATGGDLFQSALRLVWHVVRLPVYVLLAILEPGVRFVLGALALLGVLTASFLKLVGEERFITFGMSQSGRLLVVSHTEQGDTIRIFSARRATRSERRLYEEG